VASTAPGTAAPSWVREPAVAGLFYPDDADRLRTAVSQHIAAGASAAPTAEPTDPSSPPPSDPRALIAPHAGYRYSGPTAGVAYAAVAPRAGQVDRVLLAGPAHRVAVGGVGVGVTTATAWRTPLGDVPVDVETCRALVAAGLAVESDEAHAPEHSLEVHLPFILEALGPVPVVPLVVGRCPAGAVAAALAATWDGDATLVVVSSDLSHYLTDDEARARDDRTRLAIIEGRADDIGPYDACGCVPIAGLLLAAQWQGVAPRTLAVTTSAETSGDPSRVVGYGSFGFEAPRALTDDEHAWLLARARRAIEFELAKNEADPLDDADVPEHLCLRGASFVSLERDGELVGCIGSLEPTRALWRDVALNARGAAFGDPRFAPLAADEVDDTVVKVSVLSTLEPLPSTRDALLDALRPGVDGVLVEAGEHRGTFLPSVWEKLPSPDRFLTALLAKAELPTDDWPAEGRAWRYTTDEFAR
jgi:AmmeMemoRadiSam system protein B/AmmeMemoRadiSam system protein A